MSKKQHVDMTSADDKSIGFDYQYYYFLNELLNLKQGQTLGLEVMDDVHSVLSNNTQILVQLKFTTQTKTDGKPKNLTTLDVDFWKTISNWCKVITDEESGRKEITGQLDFVEKTVFLLASNKSDNETNKALEIVREYQDAKKTHAELEEAITHLRSNTKDTKLTEYLNEALNLPTALSKEFFKKLRFDLGCDEIIQKCKKSITEHFIAPERVDDVFGSLDSQLRSDNFDLVTKKQKIIIDFDGFTKKYRIHFDKARNSALVVRRHIALPDDIGEQLFIRQLVDVGDVEADDTEQISKLSHHHLLAKNNIGRWVQDGDVTTLDVEALEDDAVTHWQNLHRKAYRGMASSDAINDLAQGLIDDLRTEKLSILNQELDRPVSNGEFYDLCEQKKIGWRNDWEIKYK